MVSNNSAHRWTEDVPMVVPEINASHIRLIDAQRARLGTKRGFIAVKSSGRRRPTDTAMPFSSIRSSRVWGLSGSSK